LIVAVVGGAFYYIAILANQGDDGSLPALFAGFAMNSWRYAYIALHHVIYAALLLQVVG
jgi:hypothetical protein